MVVLMKSLVAILHERLTAAGIPVVSVRRSEGAFAVEYAPEATPQQMADGEAIVAAFDAEAEEAAEEAEEGAVKTDFDALMAKADNEIDWLDTAIAAWPTATNAQKLEVGERLLRQNREMIRAWRFVARRLR